MQVGVVFVLGVMELLTNLRTFTIFSCSPVHSESFGLFSPERWGFITNTILKIDVITYGSIKFHI